MVLLKSWPGIFNFEAVAWAVSETPDNLSFFCTVNGGVDIHGYLGTMLS